MKDLANKFNKKLGRGGVKKPKINIVLLKVERFGLFYKYPGFVKKSRTSLSIIEKI